MAEKNDGEALGLGLGVGLGVEHIAEKNDGTLTPHASPLDASPIHPPCLAPHASRLDA